MIAVYADTSHCVASYLHLEHRSFASSEQKHASRFLGLDLRVLMALKSYQCIRILEIYETMETGKPVLTSKHAAMRYP